MVDLWPEPHGHKSAEWELLSPTSGIKDCTGCRVRRDRQWIGRRRKEVQRRGRGVWVGVWCELVDDLSPYSVCHSQSFQLLEELELTSTQGAYAEYICNPEAMLLPKPESLSWEETGGMLENWLTGG